MPIPSRQPSGSNPGTACARPEHVTGAWLTPLLASRSVGFGRRCLLTLGFGALTLVACSQGLRRFPARAPLWHDADRHPFAGEPAEYYSPLAWDAADQTVFRPLTRLFALDSAGEAVNVNALDEVPDSSWFTGRLSRSELTPEQFARGSCIPEQGPALPPWTVTGAKPNGANPGFLIKDARGQRYLIKFDGLLQGPRATAADVIVSKLFHAAGYSVPCNEVVFFEERQLTISPKATSETTRGEKEPLTTVHVRQVLGKAQRLPDGRYRASTSRFLDGKPIGPFTYQGTRADDLNDVIPHEDRRELRALRVLNAWVQHFDAREQNTLDTWIETQPNQGYVAHNIIDFGDCFGSLWEPSMLGRRIGHAYYLDLGDLVEDFASFGLITRPWDEARFGPTDRVFGYYQLGSFEPHAWKPGYPNPAFGRMSEADAAWMARIVAKMTPAHLEAAVAEGRLEPVLAEYLLTTLKGRRERLLERYLSKLSPLGEPRVVESKGVHSLCVRDFAVLGGVKQQASRSYSARAWTDSGPVSLQQPEARSDNEACLALPQLTPAAYLVLDWLIATPGARPPGPLRLHLRQQSQGLQLLGLERPGSSEPPDPR